MPPFGIHLRVDDLSSDMCLQGLAVQSLHGDREQCDREEALKDFKESTSQEECFVFKKKTKTCTIRTIKPDQRILHLMFFKVVFGSWSPLTWHPEGWMYTT